MARIPRFVRSKWFVALAILALVVVGGCLTVRTLASPARLRRLVRQGLEDALGGEAQVGAVEFGLLSGVVLRDIELRAEGAEEPWASVEELHAVHSVWSLLTGSVVVDRVRIVAPRLVLDDGAIARLESLAERPAGEGPTPAVVTVERGTLEIRPNKLLPLGAPLTLGPVSLRLLNADRAGRLLDVAAEVATVAGLVSVGVSVDSSLQSAKFRVGTPDLRLERVPRGWLPEEVRARREVREAAGRVAGEIGGWLAWDGQRPQVSYTGALQLDGVTVRSDEIAVPLEGIAGQVLLQTGRLALRDVTGRLGEARFTIEDATVPLDGSRTGSARGWVENAHVDKVVRAALPPDVWKACEPLGPTAGVLRVAFQGHFDDAAGPVVDAVAEFRGLELRPPSVAFPVPPLSGTVRYDSARQAVTVDEIAGGSDAGSLEVSGTVDLGRKDPEYRLRLGLDEVRLDAQLKGALPKYLADVWDIIGIQGGAADADILVVSQGEQAPRVTGTVDAEAVSIRPQPFPYALPPLSGRIRLAPGYAVYFDRLVGVRGGLVVEGSGFVDASAAAPIPQLRVRAQGLPVDDALLAALPEAARKPVEATGVAGGAVDVNFALDPVGERAVTAVEIALHGCSLKPRDIAYSVDGLRGTVRWSDRSNTVEFRDVAGRHGEARIAVDGRADFTDPEKPRIELSLDATDVMVDDALLGVVPEPVRKQLAPLAPAGRVDIEARLVDSGTTTARTNLTVSLDGVALTPAPGAPRLTDLTGSARTDGRTLDVRSLRGRVAGLPFEADGAIALVPSSAGASLGLRIPPVYVEPLATEELPEKIAAIARTLGLRGVVAVTSTLRAPKDSVDPVLASATLVVADASLALNPQIDSLSGAFTYAAPARGTQDPAKLTVHVTQARVANLTVQNLTASAELTEKQLEAQDMAWTLYDGRAKCQLRVPLDRLTPWEGKLELAHVDVEQLARALGAESNVPTGSLKGDVVFHGVADDLSTLSVTGTCRLQDGHLYNMPFVVSVWNLFAFANPGRGAVTDARLQFRIRGDVLHLDHFLLTGEAMPMAITGTIEMKPGVAMADQKMDLVITAARQKDLLDRVPIVGWIKKKSYNQLRQYILQARATGTLDKPKLETVVTPLTKPIGQFWSLLGREAGKVVEEVIEPESETP